MDSTPIADFILKAVLSRTATGAARRVIEQVFGTDRQREFEQALRTAVSRLVERYPAIGTTSADIDFFERQDVVDRLFQLVVLGDDTITQPLVVEVESNYESIALLQGERPELVIKVLAVLIEKELVSYGTFADQFIYRRTVEMLERVRQLAPAESDGVRSLRALQREILAGPLGNTVDPELRQRERQAALALLPRPGKSVRIEGQFRFAFPSTPEGEAARVALKRALEAGHPLSMAGSYVQLADLTLNGEPFPGWEPGARIARLELEPVPRPAPSRFTLYSHDVEVASIDVLSLQLLRTGEIEDYFDAAPNAPLRAEVTAIREGGRMRAQMNFSTKSDFRDAVEQWRVLHFFSCLSEADRCVWEILGTEVKMSGTVGGASDVFRRRELAFARSLALLQEASHVKLPPLMARTREGAVQVLALARVVRRGYSFGTLESAHVKFPDVIARQFQDLAARRETFSFATLLRDRIAKIRDVEIQLGPVLQYMASVRVVELVPGQFTLLPGGSDRALEIFYRWTTLAMPEEGDFHQFGLGPPYAPPLRFLRSRSA